MNLQEIPESLVEQIIQEVRDIERAKRSVIGKQIAKKQMANGTFVLDKFSMEMREKTLALTPLICEFIKNNPNCNRSQIRDYFNSLNLKTGRNNQWTTGSVCNVLNFIKKNNPELKNKLTLKNLGGKPSQKRTVFRKKILDIILLYLEENNGSYSRTKQLVDFLNSTGTFAIDNKFWTVNTLQTLICKLKKEYPKHKIALTATKKKTYEKDDLYESLTNLNQALAAFL